MSRSPGDLPHHEITLADLDLLASARHDADAVTALRDLERTRRLLALRLVIRHVRQNPAATGPLPPVDEAWRLVVEAHRARPDVVAEAATRPQTGVWSAHALRRLRGTVEDKAPLWFHVGYLHALASAVGIRAGLRFRMTIPLWDGIAVLPGLGSCRVSGLSGWTSAVIDSDGTGFVIDGEGVGTSWRPIRSFTVGSGAVAARIHLDDVDAYRGLDVPIPPEPIPESRAEQWGSDLAEAWEVLTRDHTARAREVAAGLTVIAPRPSSFRFRPHSGSVGDGFGAAIIAAPHDPVQLAVTVVHEFQHSKLNAVGHLTELVRDDAASDCYAPWRDDPRGTAGLYQGVFAFTAIAEFWHVQRHRLSGADAALAHFEFALVRRQVTAALDTLRRRPSLTPTGRRFAARIADRLIALADAEVPADALAAAETAATDHETAWRFTHLRPPPRLVREAARRWLAGDPTPPDLTHVHPDPRPERDAAHEGEADARPPLNRSRHPGHRHPHERPADVLGHPDHRLVRDAVEPQAITSAPIASTVQSGVQPPRLDAKAVLIRTLRCGPEAFADARAALGTDRPEVADTAEGDFALVSGDAPLALALYTAELAAGSTRPGAWSGFGLALRAVSPGPAADVLLRRPELVGAVRDAVARATGELPDVAELAEWLGTAR